MRVERKSERKREIERERESERVCVRKREVLTSVRLLICGAACATIVCAASERTVGSKGPSISIFHYENLD